MPFVFDLERDFLLAVTVIMLVVKIVALVNSLLWSAEHYRVAGKLTKPGWVVILALGVACQALIPGAIGLLNLGFTIAAVVYLVDVRPALAGLRSR